MRRGTPRPTRPDTRVPYTTRFRSRANENRAKVGDAILQPGPYDGGRRRADRIGALLDFAPLKPGAENLVDVAIAGLEPGIDFDAATLVGLGVLRGRRPGTLEPGDVVAKVGRTTRSEEHTSELQSLMRISYAVFCLNKKKPH